MNYFEGLKNDFNPSDQNNIGQYKNSLLTKMDDFDIRLDPDRKDQHLIVNPEAINDLISFGEIDADDVVLEIGSGPGNITEQLAKKAKHVYALEIDRRFQPILESLKNEHPNIEIILDNFLDARLPEFDKIVANPPFSILEPMIQKFAEQRFKMAALIIGENYYQRTIAKPGSGNFTKTSLFTQGHFSSEKLKSLDKEDFYPQSRERAVIMRLVHKGKKGDFLLRKISNAFSQTAEKRVRDLVSGLCNEFGFSGKKIRLQDYGRIITPASLNISPPILQKRLQELSNSEISQLVAKLEKLKSPRRTR